MKVKEAIAVMNDENSTTAQLTEAEATFLAAGLKGLCNTVGTILRRRTMNAIETAIEERLTARKSKDFARDAIRTTPHEFHQFTEQDVTLQGLQHAATYTSKPMAFVGLVGLLLMEKVSAELQPRNACDCAPHEFALCADRTCPNSCGWPQDEMFDYLPLDER